MEKMTSTPSLNASTLDVPMPPDVFIPYSFGEMY
jgi:hypothetical protein